MVTLPPDEDESRIVAEENLAKDLAERMYREAYELHRTEMPLDYRLTLGVLIAAMRMFVEYHEGLTPVPDFHSRPARIIFRAPRR
jgi:hypothetical protein